MFSTCKGISLARVETREGEDLPRGPGEASRARSRNCAMLPCGLPTTPFGLVCCLPVFWTVSSQGGEEADSARNEGAWELATKLFLGEFHCL